MPHPFTFFSNRDLGGPAEEKLQELEHFAAPSDADQILKDAIVVALNGQVETSKLFSKLQSYLDDMDPSIRDASITGPS